MYAFSSLYPLLFRLRYQSVVIMRLFYPDLRYFNLLVLFQLHGCMCGSSQELFQLTVSLLLYLQFALLVAVGWVANVLLILLGKSNLLAVILILHHRADSYWRLLLLILIDWLLWVGWCVESITLLKHILFALLVVTQTRWHPVNLIEARIYLFISLLNHLESVEAITKWRVALMMICLGNSGFHFSVPISTRHNLLILNLLLINFLLFDSRNSRLTSWFQGLFLFLLLILSSSEIVFKPKDNTLTAFPRIDRWVVTTIRFF